MYNLRYHIASLVSVFLALAVGLLLGTIVVERGVLNAQRTTLVDSIRKDVDRVNAANVSLKASNDALASYARQSVPAVVSGMLAGRSVVVISDIDSAETVGHAADAVKAADGSVVTAQFAGKGLSLGDAKVRDAAMKALGSPDASTLETRVADTLAREWTTPGDSRVLTNALVGAGGLKFDGLGATETVTGVVVAAVFDDQPDAAAIALGRSLAHAGRFAVGVETAKRHTGEARAASAAGLSGVDDVGDPLG